MAGSIRGIDVVGRMFRAPAPLEFFDKKSLDVCIVYGANASGKSTVAAAFEVAADQARKASLGVAPADEASAGRREKGDSTDPGAGTLGAKFIDVDREPLDYSRRPSPMVSVYNEQYVDRALRFRKGLGLETIVLFEEQKDLEDQVLVAKQEVKRLEGATQNLHEDVTGANDELASKKQAFAELLKAGWAQRERRIRGRRNAPAVNDQLRS